MTTYMCGSRTDTILDTEINKINNHPDFVGVFVCSAELTDDVGEISISADYKLGSLQHLTVHINPTWLDELVCNDMLYLIEEEAVCWLNIQIDIALRSLLARAGSR